MNYYNENDPYAAQWLRNLIQACQLPVEDLRGYAQCHFFAGIGGWPFALQLAGWPSDRPVWTGSCPCQPFSTAGKGRGTADERHLWPAWFRLVAQCRPSVIFGEQVASPAALSWLDAVQDDLEGASYAVGATDLCASSVGTPHIRQRLYWMANSSSVWRNRQSEASGGQEVPSGGHCVFDGVADSKIIGRIGRERVSEGRDDDCSATGREKGVYGSSGVSQTGAFRSEWLECIDGKARPTEPGVCPLAHGVPGRVGRLRAYGNAIVPQVAAEFVRAYLSCCS